MCTFVSGKQTIKYSHTLPFCASSLITSVTEAGIMPSIEETGKRDSAKKSELYLYFELKYLKRMSTVTGNWIGKLVTQTVMIFPSLACEDSPCGVLGQCLRLFGVCGWITAIVSLTEQKVNLIQINCRVVRALAPASSQNYSRSHT